MIIVGLMAVGRQAGRHGVGEVAESSHMTCKLQAKRKTMLLAHVFKTSKSTLSDTPPPTMPYHLILAKQFHSLVTKHSNI